MLFVISLSILFPVAVGVRCRMDAVTLGLTSLYHKRSSPEFNSRGSDGQPSQPVRPSVRPYGVDRLVAVNKQWVTTVESCEIEAWGCEMAGLRLNSRMVHITTMHVLQVSFDQRGQPLQFVWNYSRLIRARFNFHFIAKY